MQLFPQIFIAGLLEVQ